MSVSPSRVPPWELSVPSPDVSLSARSKSEISAADFQSHALERILAHDGYPHYTEGSKGEEGVGTGCAFVIESVIWSFTLPPTP